MWPWRRFEVFFRKHLARKAADALGVQRDRTIAALSANPNWDVAENKEALQGKIEAIYAGWSRGVEIIYGQQSTEPKPDPFENDPLFKSVRRSAKELSAGVVKPTLPESGMGRQVLEAA